MKLKKILGVGGCVLGVAALYATFDITIQHVNHKKLPSYVQMLQKPKVRENIYDHLNILKKTKYSKQIELKGIKYAVTVNKVSPSFTTTKDLGLKIKNLETGCEISAVDTDDTLHFNKGHVGGAFYAEKPKFRSIDKLYVNGEGLEVNEQRENILDEFLKPLEQDLEKLAKEEIQRKDNIWKSATAAK